MITFPNAKINLGLNILNKREDGYHNIESLFLPIPLQDALEIIPTSGDFQFSSSGIVIDCADDDNIVVKAYRLLQADFHIPNVKIHLHKNIPFGAGLGGGSADAAFSLVMLNSMFELGMSDEKLEFYAAKIGADCAFFVKNKPAFAQGIGNELSIFDIDLKGKYLLLVKPNVTVATAAAYKYVMPQAPEFDLRESLTKPISQWKECIKNDFENSVFKQFPELNDIKQGLYANGAIYASMSGSGSSVFGIFNEKPALLNRFENCFVFEL